MLSSSVDVLSTLEISDMKNTSPTHFHSNSAQGVGVVAPSLPINVI